MAFRDDKEAAFARADALQRERDQLEAELSGANEERQDLKEELAAKERELARLRKRATAADPEQRAKRMRTASVVIGIVCALAVFAGIFLTTTRPPSAPTPTPAKVAAPEPSAQDPTLALREIHACLNGADLDVRAMEFPPVSSLDNSVDEHLDWCAATLERRWKTHALPTEASLALNDYQKALTAWRPLADELRRYYAQGDEDDDGGAVAWRIKPELDFHRAAFIAASVSLRRHLAAPLAALRADRAQARRANVLPGVPVNELPDLAAIFMDSLVGPDPDLADIERALAAMVEFRDQHPQFGSDALSSFFKYAKRLVRELRAADSTVIDGPLRSVFFSLVYYYRRAGLG